MHIALVTTFPPSRGTLCEYAEHLVRAYANNPTITKITVIADQVQQAETISIPKVSIQRCWKFNDLKTTLNIQKALRQHKPDAVVYNLQFASFGDQKVAAALGLLAPMLSRWQNIPTLTLLHNIMETVNLEQAGFGNGWRVQLMRLMGNLFTRALLCSHWLGTTMPRYVEILEKKYAAKNVFLSPHGSFVESNTQAETVPLPTTPTVMTFGKFGTYKTVEPLLEAHKIVLRQLPDAKLVIAGSDSPNALGYLERVQKTYADVKNVVFTGYVAEADVAKVFTESTVVAFPYNSTTGSSGVLHQAGQFARAAILPRIGDLADLVEAEGYQAEYFITDDPQSLAAAMLRVLQSPKYASALGQANFLASQSIPLDQVVASHVSHLQQTICKPGTQPRMMSV